MAMSLDAAAEVFRCEMVRNALAHLVAQDAAQGLQVGDGPVRDLKPPLGEDFLDISVTEGEPEVEPDCVPNDAWWELVAE